MMPLLGAVLIALRELCGKVDVSKLEPSYGGWNEKNLLKRGGAVDNFASECVVLEEGHAEALLSYITSLSDRCQELKDLNITQVERIKYLEGCIKRIKSNPLIKLLRRIRCLKLEKQNPM